MTLSILAKAKERKVLAEQLIEKSDKRTCMLEAAELFLIASKGLTGPHKQYCVTEATELFEQAQLLRENTKGIVEVSDSYRLTSDGKTFADVGGLASLKEDIRMKIIEPFKHPDVFAKFGKKAGGGILMYGPPGCGKSLIAEATAGEAKVSYFHVKASDLKSKYVGETEKNIAALFENARSQQPAIIFFDEFESLGMDRNKAGKHDKTFVSQLLTEMDGFGTKEQQILLIAATNVPWDIDPALRREGRFGTTLFVPPPDLTGRLAILELKMKGRPIDPSVALLKIAQLTTGYSGADMVSVCEAATDIPLKEFLKNGKVRNITTQDFMQALKKVKSSTMPWFSSAKQYVLPSDGLYQDIKEYVTTLYKEQATT